MGWGREGEGSGLGGQGGCERRIEVFVKIQKIKIRGGVCGGGRGQSGCERRIEIFVKIQKKNWGGGGRWGGSGEGSGWMRTKN